MTLLKRLRNLWKLSNFEIPEIDLKTSLDCPIPPKPKMAEIIKMDDPIKKVLTEE